MSALPHPSGTAAEAVLTHIQHRLGGAPSRDALTFATHFFRRVSAEDLAARPA